MKRSLIAAGAVAIVLTLLAVAVAFRLHGGRLGPAASGPPAVSASPASTPAPQEEGTASAEGFLYGRVTTDGGAVYQGRLRFGGGQEAFWSDTFYGVKKENPWAAYAPTVQRSIGIFGVDIFRREEPVELRRPFVARFGDLVRIENQGADVRVVLKSGTTVVVNRFDASDFDDGVRVWDGRRGVVDLGPQKIQTIELLPTPGLGDVAGRLHGTVRTTEGEFTGFVQWDRVEGMGTDELDGLTADGGELAVPFSTIRAIARRSPDSSLVTLADGREVVLSGTREVGQDNGGVYVEDVRFGGVLVPWGAFQRVDFNPGGSGPGYDDFPPGGQLTGSVTTRAGRRLAGRLVYDLDESETAETLDASSLAVHYTLPFGLVASIEPPGDEEPASPAARVTLHNGEELMLQPSGDLDDDGNVGVLVFVEGREQPELVPWSEVERIDFDRPAAMDPPLG